MGRPGWYEAKFILWFGSLAFAIDLHSFLVNMDRKPSGVDVSHQGERLSVCGGRDQVQKVLEQQVSTEDISYRRKHIRFLEKFCSEKMKNTVPAVQYEPLIDQRVIRVTANPMGLTAFKTVIEEQLKLIQEATADLSLGLYQLLSSPRGKAKIAEVAGIEMPKIVYDFEETQDHYVLCILSRDDTCRSVRKQLGPYMWSKEIEVNQQKIQACGDHKWRKLHHNLTAEYFVAISVHPGTCQIAIEGEAIVLDDIIKHIKKILRDHTSVAGSPQGGYMIPPNLSGHAWPPSSPISIPNLSQAEDQREGLWMGTHQQQPQLQQQQQTQKSNSGQLFQTSPQPGYGSRSKQGMLYTLFVLLCGSVLVGRCSPRSVRITG
jgi:hypothetical protein